MFSLDYGSEVRLSTKRSVLEDAEAALPEDTTCVASFISLSGTADINDELALLSVGKQPLGSHSYGDYRDRLSSLRKFYEGWRRAKPAFTDGTVDSRLLRMDGQWTIEIRSHGGGFRDLLRMVLTPKGWVAMTLFAPEASWDQYAPMLVDVVDSFDYKE
jgi:hypothetical protein